MDDDILRTVVERRKDAFEEIDLSVLDAYREAAWHEMPQDSGFKRVASNLTFRELLGCDHRE